MTITEHTTIAEIAAAIPSSVPVFERFGIDFCCGGRTTLATACIDRDLSFDELTHAIEDARADYPAERDWTRVTLTELVSHIVTTYHHRHREELPRLRAWAHRAAVAHGARHPGVFEKLEPLLIALSTELTEHMNNEERVLFPSICAREQRATTPTMPLAGVIGIMEQEHDDAGMLIAEMRRIAGGYEPPAWACATVTALYRGLADFEMALHRHVHLENNVLFPRALALPQRACRS